MKVINKEEISPSVGEFVSEMVVDLLTFKALGPSIRDNKYTVEDDYGNIRTVIARDADELGEKISNGDFEDDDD